MRRFLGRAPRPDDGLDEADVEGAENRLGVRLPLALRAYYLAVGAVDELNRPHNVILAPDELRLDDGYLVFAEENQGVVSWGLPRAELALDDPSAWQRNNTPPEEWYPEEKSFTGFLQSMLEWYEEMGLFRGA